MFNTLIFLIWLRLRGDNFLSSIPKHLFLTILFKSKLLFPYCIFLKRHETFKLFYNKIELEEQSKLDFLTLALETGDEKIIEIASQKADTLDCIEFMRNAENESVANIFMKKIDSSPQNMQIFVSNFNTIINSLVKLLNSNFFSVSLKLYESISKIFNSENTIISYDDSSAIIMMVKNEFEHVEIKIGDFFFTILSTNLINNEDFLDLVVNDFCTKICPMYYDSYNFKYIFLFKLSCSPYAKKYMKKFFEIFNENIVLTTPIFNSLLIQAIKEKTQNWEYLLEFIEKEKTDFKELILICIEKDQKEKFIKIINFFGLKIQEIEIVIAAIRADDYEYLEIILNLGAPVNNNIMKYNPLIVALDLCKPKAIQLLLTFGADMDLLLSRSSAYIGVTTPNIHLKNILELPKKYYIDSRSGYLIISNLVNNFYMKKKTKSIVQNLFGEYTGEVIKSIKCESCD